MTTSRERLSNVFDTVWQEFEKLQPEESDAGSTSFEPAIYSPRSREPSVDGKGLVRNTSTNPVQRPTSRSVPDPEVDLDEEDRRGVVIPPSPHRSSPRISAIQQQPQTPGSRTGSTTGSPISSTLSSTLGPASAATAALGQKAAGMFSNVSSFFQAKKKELIDAQREVEEQYQQRIHQHERKKKIMQERARATASTFSPKGPGSRSSTPQQVNTDVYAYVAPQSPTRSPTATSPRSAVTSPKPSSMTATAVSAASDSKDGGGVVKIIAPSPIVSAVFSPTLTRGGSSSDGLAEPSKDSLFSLAEGQQQAIEKELQEALETEPEATSLPSLKVKVPDPSALVTPTRSLTPTNEAYSPFSEISGPPSPVAAAAATVDETTPATSMPSTKDSTSSDKTPLGEALPIP